MEFYIYVSELTHNHLVFFVDKGKTFTMPDGKTYDKESEFRGTQLLSASACIHISKDCDVNICNLKT